MISRPLTILFLALLALVAPRHFSAGKPSAGLLNDWHYRHSNELQANCTKLCADKQGDVCGTQDFSCCTKGHCSKDYGMEYCQLKLPGFDCRDQRKVWTIFPELR